MWRPHHDAQNSVPKATAINVPCGLSILQSLLHFCGVNVDGTPIPTETKKEMRLFWKKKVCSQRVHWFRCHFHLLCAENNKLHKLFFAPYQLEKRRKKTILPSGINYLSLIVADWKGNKSGLGNPPARLVILGLPSMIGTVTKQKRALALVWSDSQNVAHEEFVSWKFSLSALSQEKWKHWLQFLSTLLFGQTS